MKRVAWSLGILVVVGAAVALAQPPEEGRGGRGGPPGGPDGGPGGDFRPPPPPVIRALDVDRDHTLSAEEIKNAPEELLTLDKNKDGKLTEDEFVGPPPGAGNRRGARGARFARRSGRRSAARRRARSSGRWAARRWTRRRWPARPAESRSIRSPRPRLRRRQGWQAEPGRTAQVRRRIVASQA